MSRHKSAAAAEREARRMKAEEARKFWLVSNYAVFEEKPADDNCRIYGFDAGVESFSTFSDAELAEWSSRASDPQSVRGRYIKFI